MVTLGDESEPREVRLLRLDLLQAHHVSALAREPLCESFGERRADAVEIERDNA